MGNNYKIVKQNYIDSDLSAEISHLNDFCNIYDSSSYEIFTEFELNTNHDNCVYLCYDGKILAGILTAFIPNADECWIYSATSPQYRNTKIFSTLFSEFRNDNSYEITFPLTAQSENTINILNHYNFKNIKCEYIMKYVLSPNTQFSFKTEDIPELEYEENEYSFWIKDTYIGGCLISCDELIVTIYEFYINDDYQGQGYGKSGLKLILNHLSKKQKYSSVILQVSGQNKKACNRYKSLGFEIISTEYFAKQI